jgi:NHLM bacteriocin system ABC transporter peptidase/ATP-binding protein
MTNPAKPTKPKPEALAPQHVAFKKTKRYRTPTVLQMEAVECGAASLAMILAYYGRFVPLEELRVACGVSRDGVKASNIVQAARMYHLAARGYRKEIDEIDSMPLPMIVFWEFNHFLVVEGFTGKKIYLNDPAAGPRTVTAREFDEGFTGVVLTFEPDETFQRAGSKPGLLKALGSRLANSKMALVYVVLVSLALIIPGLIVPAFTQIFVDQVLVGGQDWLGGILVAMSITALIRVVLTWLQQFYLLRLETKLALATSSLFMWHILRLPVEFFTQRYGGEISSRVQINDRVAHLLSGELATAVLNLMLVAFYTILLFLYDGFLTVVGISIALLNIIVLRYVARQRVDANQRLLQERGKLTGTAMNGLQTIETIKATGAEGDLFSRLAGYQAKSLRAEQQFKLLSQVLSTLPVLLTTLNTIVILYFGSLRVMRGELTIGELIAFQTLMLSFITPFNEIVNLGGRFQEVEGDMNRLDDVLRYKVDRRFTKSDGSRDLEVTIPVAELMLDANAEPLSKLSGRIEIRHLTFGYNRTGTPLIEDFNLTVEPGARVALVGGSGSGKSTIAKLVAGLYEPWQGEILFDGKRREDIPRRIISNSISMIDQDIFMFQGSISDNLTLWDKTVPENSIIQAGKDAAIHNDIVERPGGYEHIIEEGGRNFSGGQLQRLEIARALVGNPSIVLMDEATSALDPVTEKLIDDNLRRRGCTCLMIAHRLSTIRDADEIIVLDRGQVFERGTHDQLKDAGGLYSELIAAEAHADEQSKAYLEYLF